MTPVRKATIARRLVPIVAVCVCLTLSLFSDRGVRAEQTVRPQRVLVLYWYGRDFPASNRFEESFREVLKSAPVKNVEYYAEYFETNRFPGEDQSLILRDYLQRKYADRPIDAVVAVSDPPLDFLLKYRTDLFPNAPIIFVAIKTPPKDQLAAGPGLTGINPARTHKQTLDLALGLHPGTEQVFVISGNLEHDKSLENIARTELAGYENKVRIHYLTDLSPAELLSKTSSLPERSVVLYAWQQSNDEEGHLKETEDILSAIAPSASAPIYGLRRSNVGRGLVGGYVAGSQTDGTRIGQMTVRILNGEQAQAIPVEQAPAVYMFDSRELRHWKISEANLPAGSVVVFRQPTFWQQYKWYVVAASFAIVIQSVLLVGLLVIRRRRRMAELEQKRFAHLIETEHHHLEQVVSNVPGVVWEASVEPGTKIRKATFVSDYIEKMLGYTAEEWMSLPANFRFSMIPDEDDLDRARRDSEAVIASGRGGVIQYRLTAKDGHTVWVESHQSPIFDEQKKVVGVRGVTLDISARKHAEESLRKTEEKSSAIVQAIPDLIFIQTREGVYLDYHANNSKDLLVPAEEFLGKNMRDVLPPQLASNFMRCFERALENHEPQIVEYELTLDGADRWFEARIAGTGDNVLTVVREITDRKLSEEALRESEARFRNLADTAPVMIWITGTDKLCTYVNQQWLDFTGRTTKQELGSGWTDNVHPDDYARCLETYNAAFDRRERFRMEYRLFVSDGGFRWVLDFGTPRFSSTGEFMGYIGSCVDIHDRKASEEELHIAHEEVSRLKNQLEQENVFLRQEINLEQNFGEMIGQSDALKYVLFKVEQVAPTETSVLITGETGTGKELVARAIHRSSLRRDRPLVKVNCGALSPSLIESEFFGHEKGAFTGATARKIGRFELADGATIFLDEIGDLPTDLQVKLLRVIQEGELERLGGTRTIKVDVRIIAATNRHLEVEVKKGNFREDLWYRLNVFPITVPPLRQRRDDITLMVEHFVKSFSRKMGKEITAVSAGTLNNLREHSWPGNVRELENVIQSAVINSHGSVLRLGEDFGKLAEKPTVFAIKTLEEMERDYIVRILEDRGWRIEGQNGAAQILGMNPSTLRTRMAKLGIQRSGHRFSQSTN